MKGCREADSGCERVVVVSFFKSEGFAQESHPPVNGTWFWSVTSSTNGISTPSAYALEYTSFAVGPLAIKRSLSRATHCPAYLSRFSCSHLSDFAERSEFACEVSPSPLEEVFSSSHRRIRSWSSAESCLIDLRIWSKPKFMVEFYHRPFLSDSTHHPRIPRSCYTAYPRCCDAPVGVTWQNGALFFCGI